jgi:hypothetical protein
MTATHNIEKFWEHMRRVHNSPRPPMTDAQRRRRPPVVHPVFLTHPITGKKVLYQYRSARILLSIALLLDLWLQSGVYKFRFTIFKNTLCLF